MTIAEAREKCKRLVARVPRDLLIISVFVLTAFISFGLGYLAGQDSRQTDSVTLEESPAAPKTAPETATGGVVASKNGTKYYLPGCSGANRISDANKVWFSSAAAAAAAGYTPAANCTGIQ
jgi:hypothetical protein